MGEAGRAHICGTRQDGGLTSGERRKLAELRRESRRLRENNVEILKRAPSFARHPKQSGPSRSAPPPAPPSGPLSPRRWFLLGRTNALALVRRVFNSLASRRLELGAWAPLLVRRRLKGADALVGQLDLAFGGSPEHTEREALGYLLIAKPLIALRRHLRCSLLNHVSYSRFWPPTRLRPFNHCWGKTGLTYLLVGLDKQYTAENASEPWEAYYARTILEHFHSPAS